jgi:2-oxo-3-hexenedioate decarboxylase
VSGTATNASAIAETILAAEAEVRDIPPFTDAQPDFDAATAYDVQALVIKAKLDAGERIVGAKLGLTSRAKQQAMGVSDPLYGWLTSGMVAASGEPLDVAPLIHPRVEPEVAFLLKEEVAVPATVTSVLAATEAVFGALEVLDSRYEEFRFKLPDVIADNASSARFVLGSTAVPPSAAGDLRLVGCVLRRDGEVVATAAGGAVMGHPAASVAWLVNRLAEKGESLPAGSIVLSGGLTAPVPIGPGTSVTAEFGGGLGSVEVWV